MLVSVIVCFILKVCTGTRRAAHGLSEDGLKGTVQAIFVRAWEVKTRDGAPPPSPMLCNSPCRGLNENLAEREGFYCRHSCYLAVMPTLPR
jgi:hypothetical protein